MMRGPGARAPGAGRTVPPRTIATGAWLASVDRGATAAARGATTAARGGTTVAVGGDAAATAGGGTTARLGGGTAAAGGGGTTGSASPRGTVTVATGGSSWTAGRC